MYVPSRDRRKNGVEEVLEKPVPANYVVIGELSDEGVPTIVFGPGNIENA